MAHYYYIRSPKIFSDLLRVVAPENLWFQMSSLNRKMLLIIRLALYIYLAQTISSSKFPLEKAFCEVI